MRKLGSQLGGILVFSLVTLHLMAATVTAQYRGSNRGISGGVYAGGYRPGQGSPYRSGSYPPGGGIPSYYGLGSDFRRSGSYLYNYSPYPYPRYYSRYPYSLYSTPNFAPYYGTASVFLSGGNVYNPPPSDYAAFYGAPPDAVAPPADNRARIRLRVPADAELWFDNVKTSQTGTVRQFESPPLNPAERYSYEVRVRWLENGDLVTRTRRVIFRAGETVAVDLTQPPGTDSP